MGKSREPQIILKTDKRAVFLEIRLGGKFQIKSSGWDENRTFLEGDDLEVAVRNGRWVLCHIPAGPRPAPFRRLVVWRSLAATGGGNGLDADGDLPGS
jgi:hypothetical protein